MKYLLVVLSIATLPGCADKETHSDNSVAADMLMLDTVAEERTPPPAIRLSYAPPKTYEALERKLIRRGTINCIVVSVDSARKSVEEIVAQLNGYISSDEENDYGNGLQVDQTIRVPNENLDQFTERFLGLAKKVTSKDFSSQDVTEEFIDTQARLANKKDLEKRYRELLAHATKVTEMLEIERQLEEVRSDIESKEGQLHYLNSQVAYSTVNVSYQEVAPLVDEFSFGNHLLISLSNGWRNVLYFVLNVFEQWPFIIMGSAISIVVFRWARRMFLRFASRLTSSETPR